LNELLFDNIKLLEVIFNMSKLPKVGFNIDAAKKLFLKIPKYDEFNEITYL
jgi:hypothetical protein